MTTAGHAFISYVREDSARVDRIQRLLEGAGVPVWRDRDSLWPGEDWKQKIRQAITDDSLAFIACFSTHSLARAKSGQNEELNLAVDQLRLRRPDQPWLIPVRLDDIEIPDMDIGGGRTLRSIQWVDLIGSDWDDGVGRLIRSVNRILEAAGVTTSTPVMAAAASADHQAQLKVILRDPAGDIALHDLLMPVADRVHADLSDESRFPASSDVLRGGQGEAAIWIADLVESMLGVLDELVGLLVTACAWGKAEHYSTLTRVVERVLRARKDEGGMAALTELRWLPGVVLLYSAGLASLHGDNLGALKAVGSDSRIRDRDHGTLPLLGRGNPWRSFQQFDTTAHVLAYRTTDSVDSHFAEQLASGRIGKRYTPLSDYLHARLRRHFDRLVPDDEDYDELFDRFEVLLGALMVDLRRQSKSPDDPYIDTPPYGRYTWRDRYARGERRLEVRMQGEAALAGVDWPPVRAGLFAGSPDRAAAAFEEFVKDAEAIRQRRW